MRPTDFSNNIQKAAKVIGKTWPLYSFVTSNPLSGYENLHFKEAVFAAKQYLNATVFPKAAIYKQALALQEIDINLLTKLLKARGFNENSAFYLNQLEHETVFVVNPHHELDRIMAKWLAAFMDEGLAEWQMPYKKLGFYAAWRKLAQYDNMLKISTLNAIPETSTAALTLVLEGLTNEQELEVFTHHLAALTGWSGYINYRTEANSSWQKEFPIDFEQYLAVRLWIAKNLNMQLLPTTKQDQPIENDELNYIYLKAWEQTWQKNIIETVSNATILKTSAILPDAQLVFCIDTRSELIRRHVEAHGNYETFGYAGFFGIAMDYTNLDDAITRKSCPPIVDSAYRVTEVAQNGFAKELRDFKRKITVSQFKDYFLIRMKNMLPSTFGFVEGAGLFYGFSLLGRTLASGFLYRYKHKNKSSFENITEPQISCTTIVTVHEEIPLADKVAIVKSAFDLTGWKNFAPIVIFVGHGSHSSNNAFASSLDCGACAASPGRHNARMLAKLANLNEVKVILATEYNLVIPEDTVFIGAEHNTTTDEIELFDAEVSASHGARLLNLKESLQKVQIAATYDRLQVTNSVAVAERKANDWGETRPEWGLAKNAGFIIATRELTKNTNLNSRCFLHSYDWQQDVSGAALEGIMQGPMVVTQWINNHYYFSTVDNNRFGGGTKITHNITGKFGVVQGNGGDLKIGLPLQSVNASDSEMYHQPLRLSVLINAPIDMITSILNRNENLKSLVINEWIYLLVMDAKDNNKVKTYCDGYFVG